MSHDVKTADQVTGYHAHVYFDEASEATAAALRQDVETRFDVTMGRWHHKPVGPHPAWSYQIAFGPDHFAELVPFLALNRRDLSILVHPMTGDVVADHLDYALWLGERLSLDPAPLRSAAEG